ncbi:MAG TPA: phosphatase domain-containing protein [Thermoanaerobaculia bacterium]|nr:phosphatase domain-containing protein [Thermoanaerobaculia bacterium]
MPTRRTLHRAAHGLERHLDRRRRRFDAGNAVISPYRGFGRGHEMLVRGRVLAEKQITRASGAEPLWRNVLNTYRRFQSDELAGVKVQASYRDAVVETITDEEGHFQFRLEPRELAQHTLWHEVNLSLPGSDNTAVAHVMLPSEAAQFAVISDIDDTVLVTNATSLLGMVRSVIRNAASRLPFEGVADLYRALHRDVNPIFYVSSSPWNLYELLHDFMNLQGIPHGPMFLQDWGIDEKTLLMAAHEEHKLAQIQLLVEYYPALRFVLIGDSGQHDPEIYLRVIQTHPDRILAAIIRDVTADVRDQAVARIIEEAKTAGVEMLYVRDSAEALQHARRLGLVS